MNIIVILKMVPDVVEELKISNDQKTLDEEWLRMKLSESDEHALEEAIILKEKYGGGVKVIALEAPELDDVLYNAIAKGADQVVKINGDWKNTGSVMTAKILTDYITNNEKIDSQTLILTGSQAIDDLEGETVYYLGQFLGLNSLGVVTSITFDTNANCLTLIKEFSGGLRGEYKVNMPAIIGIQAAEKPPRYIPIAKVRSVMKTAKITCFKSGIEKVSPNFNLLNLFMPEASGKAKMIEGDPEKIASGIIELLSEHSLI